MLFAMLEIALVFFPAFVLDAAVGVELVIVEVALVLVLLGHVFALPVLFPI